MIGWYIGILGSILGIFGLYFFSTSLQRMSGELRDVGFFLFSSSCGVLLFSTLMNIFGLVELDIYDSLWYAVPVMIFLASILYLISMKKLVNLIEKLASEAKKKRV